MIDSDATVVGHLVGVRDNENVRRVDVLHWLYRETYWITPGCFMEVRVRKSGFFTGRVRHVGTRFILLLPTEDYEQAKVLGAQYAKGIIRDDKKQAFWRLK